MKGNIIVLSHNTTFDSISSIIDYLSDYSILRHTFKEAIHTIKNDTTQTILVIFDTSYISSEEISVLSKGHFAKIAICSTLQDYLSIKDIITLDRFFLQPILQDDLHLTVTNIIKHYSTSMICKRQIKELDYLKSHNDKIQKFLRDSEKMITLGQQFAGVVHEINTPLGAIKSSSENIQTSITDTLQKLPKLFDTIDNEYLKILFFKLLDQSFGSSCTISTKEERQIKKDIAQELDSINIQNSRELANKFIQIKIYNNIQEYIPLITSSYSSLIFDTAYKLADLHSSTHNITVAVEKVSKMIKSLKAYARYDQLDTKTKVSIRETLETILTIYHNQLKQGIEVIKEYEEIDDIYCYPDELNQVWTNLIHNAIQAMNNQGTLIIKLSQNNEYQIISIKDSGCGIPDNIKDKIFEPFFTTKPVGIGTGIGLDIVKQIINRHDGKITFNSTLGSGTEFIVFVPKLTKIEQK